MANSNNIDTQELLRRAEEGDSSAVKQLLERHQPRLRQMIEVRLDTQLSKRVDPSDIIQDAMAYATQKLPEFLETRPLPFYPWLREIAHRRLVDAHRRHMLAEKRTVTREVEMPVSDGSLCI